MGVLLRRVLDLTCVSCVYVWSAAIPEDPSAPEETFVFDGLVIASGTNNWACLPQFDGEHKDNRMHIIENGLIDEEIDTQERSNGVYTNNWACLPQFDGRPIISFIHSDTQKWKRVSLKRRRVRVDGLNSVMSRCLSSGS